MYIVIAGNIAVGKSSLVRLLAEHYALEPVYEAVDENPYLEDFYADMSAYAFHSQMFFLAKRLEQHLSQVNPGSRIIQDRSIYEDAAVFARNLFEEGKMTKRDYQSYQRMYGAIVKALRPPDVLIYLSADVATLRKRIGMRGRSYEQSIETVYLERLNVLYESFIAGYDLSDVLTIRADEIDFVHNSADRLAVLAKLERFGLARPIL